MPIFFLIFNGYWRNPRRPYVIIALITGFCVLNGGARGPVRYYYATRQRSDDVIIFSTTSALGSRRFGAPLPPDDADIGCLRSTHHRVRQAPDGVSVHAVGSVEEWGPASGVRGRDGTGIFVSCARHAGGVQHEAAVGRGVGQPLFRRTAKGLRTRQVGGNSLFRIIIIINVHTIMSTLH